MNIYILKLISFWDIHKNNHHQKGWYSRIPKGWYIVLFMTNVLGICKSDHIVRNAASRTDVCLDNKLRIQLWVWIWDFGQLFFYTQNISKSYSFIHKNNGDALSFKWLKLSNLCVWFSWILLCWLFSCSKGPCITLYRFHMQWDVKGYQWKIHMQY